MPNIMTLNYVSLVILYCKKDQPTLFFYFIAMVTTLMLWKYLDCSKNCYTGDGKWRQFFDAILFFSFENFKYTSSGALAVYCGSLTQKLMDLKLVIEETFSFSVTQKITWNALKDFHDEFDFHGIVKYIPAYSFKRNSAIDRFMRIFDTLVNDNFSWFLSNTISLGKKEKKLAQYQT